MSDTPVPYDPEDHSEVVLAFKDKFFAACGNPAKCATLAHELARAVALRERRALDPDGRTAIAYRNVVRGHLEPPTFQEFLRSVVRKGTEPARMGLAFWFMARKDRLREQERFDGPSAA